MKKILIGALVMAAALVAAGCGSSNGGSGKDLEVTWLYTGPKNDGGFNTSQIVGMKAMNKVDGVTTKPIYDMPYSQQSTQIVKQAIAGGSTVIVDTLGLSNLLTDACRQAPQANCYASADPAPQPENSVAYWPEDWYLGYAGGVAAGLMTKSDTVGFVGPTKIPISVDAINTYALGCQSVNPDCEVRVIFINSYYDPPAAARATNSLIDAGADVIRNYVDDPGFCQIAQNRGVYAIGEFHDFESTCPKSIVTSTVWTLSDYFVEQAEKIQDGEFEGSGSTPDFIRVTNDPGGPHLGEFGSFVPSDVESQVQDVFDQMVDGELKIEGPIKDQSGKVRVKEGKVLSNEFLLSKWDWFVEGVTASQ